MDARTPGAWHIGVIGGSGLSGGIALDDEQEIEISSPFGEPSGEVRTGMLGDVRVSFLSRHGIGHKVPPERVNYRANIDVLKRAGVTDILAISAVGSLREKIAPGDFALVNQMIDRTSGRKHSFFAPGFVGHVSLADPVCTRLAGHALAAARVAGANVHEDACYIAIEGPQFSTRAESRLYREWGADVIGMTAMPEARLAREAELPYALLAMATDWDSWRDEDEVAASDILAVMADNAERARETVRVFAAGLPTEREPSPIDTVLDHAIVTARDARDPGRVARLDAVAGRFLAGESTKA